VRPSSALLLCLDAAWRAAAELQRQASGDWGRDSSGVVEVRGTRHSGDSVMVMRLGGLTQIYFLKQKKYYFLKQNYFLIIKCL
jgi:hypothetical protein